MVNKKLNGGQLAGGNPKQGRVADDFYATAPDDTRVFLSAVDYDFDQKVRLRTIGRSGTHYGRFNGTCRCQSHGSRFG